MILNYLREEILRTLVMNTYESHHKEIFLAVNNEYSDFNQVYYIQQMLRYVILQDNGILHIKCLNIQYYTIKGGPRVAL